MTWVTNRLWTDIWGRHWDRPCHIVSKAQEKLESRSLSLWFSFFSGLLACFAHSWHAPKHKFLFDLCNWGNKFDDWGRLLSACGFSGLGLVGIRWWGLSGYRERDTKSNKRFAVNAKLIIKQAQLQGVSRTVEGYLLPMSIGSCTKCDYFLGDGWDQENCVYTLWSQTKLTSMTAYILQKGGEYFTFTF